MVILLLCLLDDGNFPFFSIDSLHVAQLLRNFMEQWKDVERSCHALKKGRSTNLKFAWKERMKRSMKFVKRVVVMVEIRK